MALFKFLVLFTLLCSCSSHEPERVDAASGVWNATSLSGTLDAGTDVLDLIIDSLERQYPVGNSSSTLSLRQVQNGKVSVRPAASNCGIMSSCNLELMRTVTLFKQEFRKSSKKLLDTVPEALMTPAEMRKIAGEYETHRKRLRPRLSVLEKIKKAGYPVETHKIQTEDGYILTYYRIPYGRSNDSCGANADVGSRKPVLLHHGLFGHSGFWVTQEPSRDLPYQLADLGFDVWLANCRGTNESQAHLKLDPKDKEFWDFSFDEIGRYDLPAAIDYILETTKQEKLIYIGHSMGTTVFFVGMSERPEYNRKIDLMIALAPVAYGDHATSIAIVLAPLGFFPLVYQRYYPVMPGDLADVFRTMAYGLCGPKSPTVSLCASLYFLIYGFDYTQTDFLKLAEFVAEGVNPISIKVVQHFAQVFVWKDFRHMNEGISRNCRDYGSCLPPKYNLSRVTAKVALFYSENDQLAVPQDVQRLRRELPNVVLNHNVEYAAWNHMDFAVAKDVNKLVFYPVLNVINKYVQTTCQGPPFDRHPEYVDSD